MNAQRDADAILAAWLEEGPTRLPDATRRAIAVNARTTDQRRQPIWMPQRRPRMNLFARMAVAAIAIAVVIGGAWYAFAPAGQVGGPPPATAAPTSAATPAAATASPVANSAVPSASALANASAAPSPSTMAAGGEIFPGRYRTALDPPLTLTIDREVEHNCAPGFQCRGSVDSNTDAWLDIEFGLPRIEVSVFRVDKVFDPAKTGRVIDVPADLVTWLASHPGLTVTAQKGVVVGGRAGTQLDIQIGAKAIELAPITGVTDPRLGFGANGQARLIVVPVAGHQIVINLGGEGQPYATTLSELQPLVDSITWE